MTIWETMVLALGGPAILIAAMAFLAKSLLTQWFARELKAYEATLTSDVKAFEIKLKAQADSSAEQLKSELQRQASDHQIRFSRLHEKRAEVIAKAYQLLVEALWDMESFVSPVQFEGDKSLPEKYTVAYNKLADLYRYLDVHQLFLPASLCAALQEILNEMRGTVIQVGTYTRLDNDGLPDHVLQQKWEIQMKAWDKLKTSIPDARKALETELRALLGPVS
ncbi:hypothetical protein [Cupriavidus basilensis]|uniref:hypothetical protein n=1 Tax=Cupriavidus basilensis TaxID=68895 RepID=UPI00157B0D6D|nr:hypothetical protein [Cupriavidus basilensis]NUA26093.1 hypothetical protein [Cupriavidus basilensis]